MNTALNFKNVSIFFLDFVNTEIKITLNIEQKYF